MKALAVSRLTLKAGGISLLSHHWDILLLLGLTAAVFRPWDSTHLPLTDFGLFLFARGNSDSLVSQYSGIAGYYIGEGRFCLIIYLYMALASAAFGTGAPGWHWTYFALNVAVLLLGRSLFSRLGVNRSASFVALALWAMMGPTAELWIRPAGEPIVLILFLTAMHLAHNYADAPDWRRRAVVIAACAVGMVFTKELLVVLLPAGWLFSRLRQSDGEWSWAAWDRRDTVLLGLVGTAVVTASVPAIYVAANASASSYAAQYSMSASALASLIERLELVLVPSAPRLHWLRGFVSDPGWTIIRTLPNLLWIAMIVLAVASAKRRRIVWPVVIGITWLAAGVIAYLPWPSQGMFYMMPFALGTMFLAAHALNVPLAPGSRHRRAAFAVATLLIAVASIEARGILYQHRLRADLNAGVIDAISRQGGADLLIGAVPSPLPGTGGWANHIRGFGSASTDLRVAQWKDLSCADAKAALESEPRAVVVSSAGGCGEMVRGSLMISGSVPRARWPFMWKTTLSEGRMYVARGSANRRFGENAVPRR